MKRHVLLYAAIAALAGAVVITWSLRQVRGKTEPQRPPAVSSLARRVAGVGLVEPSGELVNLNTAVSGLVVAVEVRAGERVSAGQPLFRLDGRDLTAELAVREEQRRVAQVQLERLERQPRAEEVPPARARVEEAKAALADAEASLAFARKVADGRAISAEDLSRRTKATDAARARLKAAQAELDLLLAGAWKQDLEVARSQLSLATAQVERVRADLERLIVRAPQNVGRNMGDAEVLRVDVRPGEYAQAGRLADPLLRLGAPRPYHVRVDFNEEEVGTLDPTAPAEGFARGDGAAPLALTYVRTEPYVTPKRVLTGATTERVDTRVLQVIYALAPQAPVQVGQQLDVFAAKRAE